VTDTGIGAVVPWNDGWEGLADFTNPPLAHYFIFFTAQICSFFDGIPLQRHRLGLFLG
jgi:hypothetical protein